MPAALGLREDVLAWMAANLAGPSEAARHFDLSVGTVTSWQNRAKLALGRRGDPPPAPRAPAAEKTPRAPAADPLDVPDDPIEWRRHQLAGLERQMREATPKEYAALSGTALRYRREIDALTAPKPNEIPTDETTSTETVVAELCELIASLPLAGLDRVREAEAEARDRLETPMGQRR